MIGPDEFVITKTQVNFDVAFIETLDYMPVPHYVPDAITGYPLIQHGNTRRRWRGESLARLGTTPDLFANRFTRNYIEMSGFCEVPLEDERCPTCGRSRP
jgi:hypothetical protein